MKKVSGAFTLVKEDWWKILVGASIAVLGALITFLLDSLSGMDFGEYTYIIIPIISILLNAARKYISETKY